MRLSFSILFSMISGFLCGQETAQDTVKKIIIEADNRVELLDEGIDSLRGNVIIEHNDMFMFCDTALKIQDTFILAYGNVAVLQSDTLEIFCDTMKYWSNTGLSDLIGHVVLDNQGKLLKSDRLLYDTKKRIANYYTESVLRDSTSLIRSKKGVYYLNREKAIFIEDVQIIDTAFHLRTDSLIYNTEDRIARFFGPTEVRQDSADIYCLKGKYDINKKEATFENDVQMLKGDSKASCDLMVYNGQTKEYVFEGNAELYGTDEVAKGDQIIYNEESESFTITGNAYYQSEDNTAEGGQLVVNGKTGVFETFGRTTIINQGTELTGEETSFNDQTGIGKALGDVVWQDTINNSVIYCEDLDFRRDDFYADIFGGAERPLFVNYGEEDTLYIAADTLLQRLFISENNDTSKYFMGDNQVKIIGKQFQGIADSLIYNTTDSIFMLIGNPIMWTDSMQFRADTITLFMVDGSIDKAKMRSNSFITMISNEGIFDQIKGKDIDAFFVEDDLDKMELFGGGETIYFIKDDEEKYIGANTTQCSDIIFFFEEKELVDIKYIASPKSKLQPMDKIDPFQLKLEGFSWDIDRKPKDIIEIRKWN